MAQALEYSALNAKARLRRRSQLSLQPVDEGDDVAASCQVRRHPHLEAVAPGMVDTALLDGKVDDAGKRRVAEGVPLGRPALPDDVANACVFLASDLSA